MSIQSEFSQSSRLLLGPGPSNAHPRVLSAMTTPLLGHLDPQFLTMMAETQDMLKSVFQTKNPLTFPVSATGMAGMETCVFNLIEPNDRMVICTKGYFGQRIVEVAGRTGAQLTILEAPWGEAFDLDRIRDTLQKVRPKVLAIVHAETSTGVWQPIEQLGKLCHEFDTLLLVDAVTSLGCIPLDVDDWELDAVFSCSQKGLGCPPGLSPISFSPRAEEAMARRKTKVQSWYFDITMIRQYWGSDRAYHHTAPISMIYALREGLQITLEEGLTARWERHNQNHLALRSGLLALGLQYTAAERHQLPQLHAIRIPEACDDLNVRKQMLNKFSIEIGAGLGEFKGKVWRIGLMGYNSTPNSVIQVLAALEQCIPGKEGKGTAAAEAAYAD